MEDNLILEGLLSMVTELKEKQEQQATPARQEEVINRLDVIEQRILEIQGKSTIPESALQEIINQITSIKKGQSENQKQDLEDIKGLIVTSHRYFKEKLKVLLPVDTQQPEEAKSFSMYDKILNLISIYLKPKFFLFSAGIIICLVSLALNIHLAKRMQQLQDNDIKYRYLLMKGKADGMNFDLLEINFSRKRNNVFIQNLTDTVIDFEYQSRKQAETLERARLLNEQARRLKEEADKWVNNRIGKAGASDQNHYSGLLLYSFLAPCSFSNFRSAIALNRSLMNSRTSVAR